MGPLLLRNLTSSPALNTGRRRPYVQAHVEHHAALGVAARTDATARVKAASTLMCNQALVHSSNMASEYQLGQKFQLSSQRLLRLQEERHRDVVGSLKKALAAEKVLGAASRRVAWELTRKLESAKRAARGVRESACGTRQGARLEAQAQAAVHDTLKAFASMEELSVELADEKEDHAVTAKERDEFKARAEKMEEALKATTPWPSLLGQKRQRYDIYILETVLMLMAGGPPAEEAVGSLAVFLQQSYPTLSAGTDYRIPGPWFFKAAAQCLYPLGLIGPSNLLEVCKRWYGYLDGSPRGGFSYFGMGARIVVPSAFIDDGDEEDAVGDYALGLDLLANGEHATEADHVGSRVGEHLVKCPLWSSDCAAKGVIEKIFTQKDRAVAELKQEMGATFDLLDPDVKEVMVTNVIAECCRHVDQLFQGKLFKHESRVQSECHIERNCSLRLQVWAVSRLFVKGRTTPRMRTRCIAWMFMVGKRSSFTLLPNKMYGLPMVLEKLGVATWPKNGALPKRERPVYRWVLQEDPPDIWRCMMSFSNLAANTGKHSKYYLNEVYPDPLTTHFLSSRP